jgi:hypothetical protein
MKLEFDGIKFKLFDIGDLNLINEKYSSHNTQFITWANNNNIGLPSLSSAKGQIIALITDQQFINKLFTREMLGKFLNKFDINSNDVIQIVNKTDQWGLLHKTYKRKYYYIPRPFTLISIHLNKRKGFSKLIDEDTKKENIKNTKDFLKKYYIDIPDKDWDIGHIDPNGSSSSNNIVMQPPIQRAYRNRFKFDKYGLRLCPTVDELSSNLNKYYSKEEIDKLKELLIGS